MSGIGRAVRSGIRNIWGHGDEDDYTHDEGDTPHNEPAAPGSAPASYRGASDPGGAGGYSRTVYSAAPRPPVYGGGSGGSSTPNTPGGRRLRAVPSALRSSREKNIYTLKPKSQDDAAIGADYLKTGVAVIINLDEVDRANAVRIIDFMSGVCYGLEGQGHAMKLGDTIFLYTPPDFDISSDETDYGENTDFFFKDLTPHAPASNAAGTPSNAAPPGAMSAPGGMTAPSQHAAPPPTSYQTAYQAGERRSWER